MASRSSSSASDSRPVRANSSARMFRHTALPGKSRMVSRSSSSASDSRPVRANSSARKFRHTASPGKSAWPREAVPPHRTRGRSAPTARRGMFRHTALPGKSRMVSRSSSSASTRGRFEPTARQGWSGILPRQGSPAWSREADAPPAVPGGRFQRVLASVFRSTQLSGNRRMDSHRTDRDASSSPNAESTFAQRPRRMHSRAPPRWPATSRFESERGRACRAGTSAVFDRRDCGWLRPA